MAQEFEQITSPPQAQSEVIVNESLEAVQHISVYGYKAATSSGLTWGYYGGRWNAHDVTAATLTLTNSATNYIVVERSNGTASVSTSSTNHADTTNYARVYTVVVAGGVPTTITDERLDSSGVLASGGGGGGGSGDVVGQASSVTARIATFNGTSGKSIQDGGKTIADLRVPAIQTVTSSATVTPTFDDDMVKVTAQAAGLTLANPTGTAIPGLGMVLRIKDNGTARSISYGSQYRAVGITLPTTTVISKTLYMAMVYNSDDTKWDVVAVAQEA